MNLGVRLAPSTVLTISGLIKYVASLTTEILISCRSLFQPLVVSSSWMFNISPHSGLSSVFSVRYNTIDFLKIKLGVEVEGWSLEEWLVDGGGRWGMGEGVERSIEDEQQNEWPEHELLSP